MFQLDNNFLESVGLGGMPEDQKPAFIQHIYEELEYRVGSKLSEGLTEAQMKEFEEFVAHNEAVVNAWLAENIPQYESRADYLAFAKSAPADVSDVSIKAEYASLRWLELNRPDYRQVVADTIEVIRQEILANKEAILGAV